MILTIRNKWCMGWAWKKKFIQCTSINTPGLHREGWHLSKTDRQTNRQTVKGLIYEQVGGLWLSCISMSFTILLSLMIIFGNTQSEHTKQSVSRSIFLWFNVVYSFSYTTFKEKLFVQLTINNLYKFWSFSGDVIIGSACQR